MPTSAAAAASRVAAEVATDIPSRLSRIRRRIASERASVYLEYALVTSVVLAVAALAFNPESWFFKGLGVDYTFREVLIKLPIF